MKFSQRLAIGYIQTNIKLLSLVSKRKAAKKALQVFCTPLYRSKKRRELIHTVPIQFSFRNKRINGYQWNQTQNKKALLLHGFSSGAHNFEDYGNLLARQGYEVLAFDAPAHGESEGKRINTLEYRDMVMEINKTFGPFDCFLAHSFGGIALSLALEEIPHDEQTKVVFIAPATETSTAVKQAFNLLKITSNQVQDEFEKIVYEYSGKPIAWYSMRRAMHQIRASVLWIHDEQDETTPVADALQVKEDSHSNIRFLITNGLGHQKIYRNYQVKRQVIQFFIKP